MKTGKEAGGPASASRRGAPAGLLGAQVSPGFGSGGNWLWAEAIRAFPDLWQLSDPLIISGT